MTKRGELDEYTLHTMAIIAARKKAGLDLPTASPEDPWWSEGPHIEMDGHSYYVHAMGCLRSQLGQVMDEHPDWYLVAAYVRGRQVEIHGLDDSLMTLAEVQAKGRDLTPDEMRLAMELTAGRAAEEVGGVAAEAVNVSGWSRGRVPMRRALACFTEMRVYDHASVQ